MLAKCLRKNRTDKKCCLPAIKRQLGVRWNNTLRGGFVPRWEIACDYVQPPPPTQIKEEWCRADKDTRPHWSFRCLRFPGKSHTWPVREDILFSLFFFSSFTSEGKFHLYTCKFTLHIATVYVSLPPFYGYGWWRFWVNVAASLSFNQACSSFACEQQVLFVLTDNSRLGLSHHFLIYSLSLTFFCPTQLR